MSPDCAPSSVLTGMPVRVSGRFLGCLVKLPLMFRSGSPLSKAAAVLAVVFAVLSAGFVVVQQCHGQESVAVTSNHHQAGHSSESAPVSSVGLGTLGSSILGDLCVGVFFLVLIVGGKFLLKVGTARYRIRVLNFWAHSKKIADIWRSGYVLSLPQLGICRI